MNDILWLTMRRLRLPLILLILVYSFSVIAMVMVPGVDPDGNPIQVGYLDAAYFVAIMATTIGFGEYPYAFTGAQRMTAFIIILPNVVAWLYSIGTILGLFLDPQFKAVLALSRFRRKVLWMGEPYYVVCGFGNTGSMIARGLISRGLGAVVLEQDADRTMRMILDDDFAHIPILNCDTTDKRNLELAGISNDPRYMRDNCRGVIACTNDDHANLTIAITVKLLRPDLPVFARSENERVSANMTSFGTEYVINPYAIFAERLYIALTSPVKYLVQDWLISVPGSELREWLEPPTGRWIVAGAGRFGERMLARLQDGGLPFTVIDVHEDRIRQFPGAVLGRGTEAATLEEAGIADAVGIIASTGDDIDNLSIVMTARELNRDLFVVARQEQQQNDALFDACGADLVAKRSMIVARRILAVATTPLLQIFLQHLVREDERFAEQTMSRLKACLHGRAPSLWVARLTGDEAEGIRAARELNVELDLRHLTHNARSETGESLPCVCLMLERGAQRMFLPADNQRLLEGDRLLFAGRPYANREMERTLADPTLLVDFATPGPVAHTAIGRWWQSRQKSGQDTG